MVISGVDYGCVIVEDDFVIVLIVFLVIFIVNFVSVFINLFGYGFDGLDFVFN